MADHWFKLWYLKPHQFGDFFNSHFHKNIILHSKDNTTYCGFASEPPQIYLAWLDDDENSTERKRAIRKENTT